MCMGEVTAATERTGLLIALGGRPGSGKSTIAQRLARDISAVYLRVDTIEQALLASGVLPPGTEAGVSGYLILYRIAEDNLRFDRIVIADTVNPLEETRQALREVARTAGARLLQVEVCCSDADQHRHRIETRLPEIEGHSLPTWHDVIAHDYQTWPDADLKIDTAKHSVEECVALIAQAIAESHSS